MKKKNVLVAILFISVFLFTSCNLKFREIYTAKDESFRIRYDKQCELKDMLLSFDDLPYMGEIGEDGIILANESYEKGYIINKSFAYVPGNSSASNETLKFKSLAYLDQLGFLKDMPLYVIKSESEKINGRNYLLLSAPFYDKTLGSFVSAISYKDNEFYHFVYYERRLNFPNEDLYNSDIYDDIHEELYKDIKKVRLESVGQSWISSTFIGYLHGYFSIVRWPFTWGNEKKVYDDWSKSHPGWYKIGFILGIIVFITSPFKKKRSKE